MHGVHAFYQRKIWTAGEKEKKYNGNVYEKLEVLVSRDLQEKDIV